jgi:outer membrane murein-binding lipoprotein Lpp
MKAAAAILALTLGGCVSHTAAIGEAASDVRTDVAVAKEHLGEARAALDRIDVHAATVHNHLGHVSDDENPFVEALRYGSYIVGAAVVGALAFIIHQRTK